MVRGRGVRADGERPAMKAAPAPPRYGRAMADRPQMEVLDYATYGVAVKQLALMVHDSGYAPDMILAIARGGLLVAG